MVASSNPRAIAFVITPAKSVTTRDKNKIKAVNCKKITLEKVIFLFDFAYEGINTWVKAPSAKILLKRLGSLNATKKISL